MISETNQRCDIFHRRTKSGARSLLHQLAAHRVDAPFSTRVAASPGGGGISVFRRQYLLPAASQVTMTSSAIGTRRRRRTVSPKTIADGHDTTSVRRGNSSASLEGVSPTSPPQRPKLERRVTQEMESIEDGMRNVSVFDVLLPFSKTVGKDNSLSGGKLLPFPPEIRSSFSDDQSDDHSAPDSDVHRYMARREMTPLQERLNAITIIPGAFYCFLYLLSGAWLDRAAVLEARHSPEFAVINEDRCVNSSWLPHLHALPPLPVLAAALGIICHAPFSFIYHWSYAHRLPAGFARTNHWSRRWDQAMIHFCSAFMSYATSGQLDFFLANLMFNADCFYRQFQPEVRPKRNQVRIAISCVAYTIPILRRGDLELFAQLWGILSLSFILFGFYPIGGWSHAAFHLVLFFLPPLLMNAALELPASQGQLKIAAQCAALAREAFES